MKNIDLIAHKQIKNEVTSYENAIISALVFYNLSELFFIYSNNEIENKYILHLRQDGNKKALWLEIKGCNGIDARITNTNSLYKTILMWLLEQTT